MPLIFGCHAGAQTPPPSAGATSAPARAPDSVALNDDPSSPASNAPANADQTAPGPAPVVPTSQRWSLRFEPGVWYLGIGGDLRLPGSNVDGAGNGDEIDIDELGVDSPTITPTGEAHLFFGEVYRASLRGYALGENVTTTMSRAGQLGDVPFIGGSQLRSSVDFSSLELEVGARIHHSRSQYLSEQGLLPFESDIALFAGAQLLDLDWDVRRLPDPTLVVLGDDSTDYSATWLIPRVGGKWQMRLYETFLIDLTVGFALLPLGESSATTGDIIAGFAWEPHPNFGVQIGYRAAEFDLRDGDDPGKFEFSGGNQGLQFSVVGRF